MNIRKQYAVFIVTQLGLAAVLFWSGSATWIDERSDPELGGLVVTQAADGTQIIPLIPVSSVIAICAVLGVIATGAWGRRIIGVATAGVSSVTVVAALSSDIEGVSGWTSLVIVLSVGLVLTSVSVVVMGPHWPQLGRKYRRDDPSEPPSDPWKALDQGIDPTIGPDDKP